MHSATGDHRLDPSSSRYCRERIRRSAMHPSDTSEQRGPPVESDRETRRVNKHLFLRLMAIGNGPPWAQAQTTRAIENAPTSTGGRQSA